MKPLEQVTIKPNCATEYDRLETVILCRPEYMKIREIINETQQQYIEENITTSLALKQHDELVQKLQKHGIDIMMLPTKRSLPEQVFTRDIGFTVGNVLCVASMKRGIRQGEETVLREWLDEQMIPYAPMKESIEGGDVIIEGSTIWVGQSDRTSYEAASQLQKLFPNYHVEAIDFDSSYLHLDCVFNPISPNEALVYSPAIKRSDLEKLKRTYDLIEVSEEEQFTLGTNVLSIGEKKVFSLPVNQGVSRALRKRGYSVIEVDISEIIKSGGSFRCITLPLVRKRRQ